MRNSWRHDGWRRSRFVDKTHSSIEEMPQVRQRGFFPCKFHPVTAFQQFQKHFLRFSLQNFGASEFMEQLLRRSIRSMHRETIFQVMSQSGRNQVAKTRRVRDMEFGGRETIQGKAVCGYRCRRFFLHRCPRFSPCQPSSQRQQNRCGKPNPNPYVRYGDGGPDWTQFLRHLLHHAGRRRWRHYHRSLAVGGHT